MTSRQPGTAPRGTGSRADPKNPASTGQEQTPRLAAAHYWPPVLVLALLIILGMAGLRGAATGLSWNGPLWQDRVVVGVALEIILGILLVHDPPGLLPASLELVDGLPSKIIPRISRAQAGCCQPWHGERAARHDTVVRVV